LSYRMFTRRRLKRDWDSGAVTINLGGKRQVKGERGLPATEGSQKKKFGDQKGLYGELLTAASANGGWDPRESGDEKRRKRRHDEVCTPFLLHRTLAHGNGPVGSVSSFKASAVPWLHLRGSLALTQKGEKTSTGRFGETRAKGSLSQQGT